MNKTASAHSLNLERFLATLYVDPVARARFLAAPESEAARAGLSRQQALQLKEIDFTGLAMASRSFVHKRAFKQAAAASHANLLHRFLTRLSRQEWFARIPLLRMLSPKGRQHP